MHLCHFRLDQETVLAIGQKFAMLEAKTILSHLIRQFELIPVDKPEDVKPVIELVLKPLNGIRVKFRKR